MVPSGRIPYFSPKQLLGRTVLLDEPDGTTVRAKIVEHIEKRDKENHQQVQFILSTDDGRVREIIEHNELSDLVERQVQFEEEGDPDALYGYEKIVGHQGPLNTSHPNYMKSTYNVLLQWDTGEVTKVPLDSVFKDDPVTVADYAKKQGLLDTDGWKRCKRIVQRTKKFERMVKAAKRNPRLGRNEKRYKFGIQLPRTSQEAFAIDADTGTTFWKDAIQLELDQMDEYNTFQDHGISANLDQSVWKRIRVHFVFDVKHDLRRKA